MEIVDIFPPLNASLNAISGACVLTGFVHIKRGHIQTHKRFMLAGCIASLLFLICYVVHHILRGGVVTNFTGTGFIRAVYFTMLTTHTMLAITVLPLAIITVINGLKMRVAKHRRIARWTFPIWMYVSTTGVLVYFFLYRWYPSR
jgi:uncharacterized membrane protein YozB (DUF420 family)